MIVMRAALKTRRAQVSRLERQYMDAADDQYPDAALYGMEYQTAAEALTAAEIKLKQREAALGVAENQELKRLASSEYIRLRMNARALKRRLRDRLRSRKFELDKVERSFRRLVNGERVFFYFFHVQHGTKKETEQKLYAHTESAVKRREPTINKLNNEYNKLCENIAKLIKERKAPAGAIAPRPIPAKQLWKLDVDNAIWEDVGLDDEEPNTAPPAWLCNEKVQSGIKAMLELDRCEEEDIRLKKERCALQVWFAEEWAIVNLAIDQAGTCILERLANQSTHDLLVNAPDKYQLELLRDNLVRLCATWEKWLPDLGVDEEGLPPWGPSAPQLAMCIVDAHLPARGKDRHYAGRPDAVDDDGEEDIEAETGGEDQDFETLEALATADVYRNETQDDYY